MSTPVDLYVHGKTGAISKTVIPQDVSVTTLDISQTTLSVWLKSDSSFNLYNDENNKFELNTLSGISYDLPNTIHHASFLLGNPNIDVYLNGYYFNTISGPSFSSSEDLLFETVNTYSPVLYLEHLNQRQLLTSYYDFLRITSAYANNAHSVIVHYPENTSLTDISFVYSGFISDDGNLTRETNESDVSFQFPMTELELNLFHKNGGTIEFGLPEYGVETFVTGVGNPYIDYTYDDSQRLAEGVDISFVLVNTAQTYNYIIDDTITEPITELDLSSGTISGTINNSPLTLTIKDDNIVDSRKGFETLLFSVPDLSLSTQFTIYDRSFFTVTNLSDQHITIVNYAGLNNGGTGSDVFVITLHSIDLNSDVSFDLAETFDLSDVKVVGSDGNDEDLTSYTGIFNMLESDYLIQGYPVYVAKQTYRVNSNPENDPTKFNLPFQIALQADLSYVNIDVTMNDQFNLQHVAEVTEGDTFIITLNTPITIPDGTTYTYTVNFNNLFTVNDLSGGIDVSSGTFVIQNHTSDISFTILKDQYSESSDEFVLVVRIDELSYNILDLSTSIIVNDFVPTLILTSNNATYDINEGEVIDVTLDTSGSIPDGLIAYTIVGDIQEYDLVTDTSYSSISGVFDISNNTDTLSFKLKEDRVTDGLKVFILQLDEYPDVSLSVNVVDTSTYQRFDLSSNKTSVDEGDTFTITLQTDNVVDLNSDKSLIENGNEIVPYVITGVQPANLRLGTLEGNFTLDASGTGSVTFETNADRLTEGEQTVTLRLSGTTTVSLLNTPTNTPTTVSLNDIFVNVIINDTSQGPKYFITLSDTNRTVNNAFSTGSIIRIQLTTESTNPGTFVWFLIESPEHTDDLFDSLPRIPGSDTYYGKFITGTIDTYELVMNQRGIYKIKLSNDATFYSPNSTNPTQAINELQFNVYITSQ
jgi:hypothetical protein